MRLGPQIVPFRRNEALFQTLHVRRRHRPVRLRPLRGAAARHLIDDIDGIAAAQEELRPPLASVRRAGEVRAGLAAAVNHHDRKRMDHLVGNLKLNIHVADHRCARTAGVYGAAGEEPALPGDGQRLGLALRLCIPVRRREHHRSGEGGGGNL